MSKLTRWNPFRTSLGFDPMTDIDELFRNLAFRPYSREIEGMREMRIDVAEDDRAYRVQVDMPGIRKEDIEVSVDGNQVTIQAESKREESKTGGKELYSERYFGKSFRTFTLPHEIDGEKCDAQYADGVLKLSLPKKSNGQSKRLAVH